MDSGLCRNDGFIGYFLGKKYFAKVSGRRKLNLRFRPGTRLRGCDVFVNGLFTAASV